MDREEDSCSDELPIPDPKVYLQRNKKRVQKELEKTGEGKF
jgi:hypothetical protein